MTAGVVGIDVGGTFTDLTYSRDGTRVDRVVKVLSTPQDPSQGLVDALVAAGIEPDALGVILHGTTIATNAVIERKGARAALVTTKGFRDVLELGRRDRQSMYGLTGSHQPLIPRERRWEIDERLDHRGAVVTPLDECEVRRLAEALRGEDLQSIVIAFLHSYANPEHEVRAANVFRAVNPAWEITTSASIVREYYEFERTSTAVVQGYLQPLVARYARGLSERLAAKGYTAPVLVMQSNGGLAPLRQLASSAARIVRSGPAAGVMAAATLAGQAGFNHVITGDMGGTSYDVAVVVGGRPRIAETTELDFRIPLRLPMIDVHTIGAGGGSIAYLDRGGILQVGPRSAGALPGPVCFARGGTEPTVTDANAVLARINPDHPIGMQHLARLDVEAARRAVAGLGERLGLGLEATAEAILTIVNQRMAGRTRLLSVEQGHDPRDFALVAFGGAGPLHGAAIMREVGIRTMLIPPHPGVLCALGCAIADIRHDLSQTVERALDTLEPGFVAGVLARQRREGEARLAEDDLALERIAVSHSAQMSYVGQIHALTVPVETEWSLARMAQAFEQVYAREYGNTLGAMPKSLVSLKTAVLGVRRQPVSKPAPEGPPRSATPSGKRPVHFGHWLETPIFRREQLEPGMRIDGPAVVEQADTTTIIEPGMRARVDGFGNLLVEIA